MRYVLLADIVVLVHIGFVLFVLFGGLLIVKWPRIIRLHLPAVAWGILVEWTGWICPLTPLENWLRTQAGGSHDKGDFLLRFLDPILYPEALTQSIQIALGICVLAANLTVYGWLWRRHRAGKR